MPHPIVTSSFERAAALIHIAQRTKEQVDKNPHPEPENDHQPDIHQIFHPDYSDK